MNVLLTGAWNKAKDYVDKIESLGHSCIFIQNEDEELNCSYDWPNFIACGNLFKHHNIEKFSNLKYIQAYSHGLDSYPIDYILSHGIKINNAKGVYSIPIAENVVLGILQVCKNSKQSIFNQKEHKWEKNREYIELSNKNVCIVGCGSIGCEVANKIRPFCKNIFGICRSAKQIENFDNVYESKKLCEVLKDSDVVVVCLPLNDQTNNMFDAQMLSHIKDGAIFVNVSRGKIVDEEALILESNRFRGVFLDVFAEEPLNNQSKLWDLDNVYITPHNAFVSDYNEIRMWNVISNFLKEA